MKKSEATKILAILTAAYPNFYKNLSVEEANGVVSVWTIQFADVPADIVFMAVNKAISSCKYPPSIAEVKERITGLYWDAYSALASRDTMSPQAVKEYERIYELTKDYRCSRTELELDTMLLGASQRYLLE